MSVDDGRQQLRNLLRKAPTAQAGQGTGFNPAEHTVAQVQAYVDANPSQRQAVLDAERAGKNRTTLVDSLEEP